MKIIIHILILLIPLFCSATPTKLRTFQGIDNGQSFGLVFAALGDLNGDGTAEVLAAQVGNQKVFIYSGADGSILKTLTSPTGSRFGSAVTNLGDVNADGLSDFAISDLAANNSQGRDSGLVHVYSGNPATDYALLYTVELVFLDASDASAFFGYDIKAINDVNGDGVKDLLISAPAYNASSGLLRLVSGANGATIWTVTSPTDANFGIAAAQIGDRNSDNVDDLVVGIPGTGPATPGKAEIRSGKDGSLISPIANPASNRFLFACNAESLGDANGDGVSDYALVSLVSATNSEYEIKVFSGSDDSLLFTVSQFTQLCVPVTFSKAGDVNQDGYMDLVVGEDQKNSGAGSITVYSGFDGSVIETIDGTNGFGNAVSYYTDSDDNAYPEVLVGQGQFNSNIGGVHVYSIVPELQSANLTLSHNKKGQFEFVLTPVLDVSAGGCTYTLYGSAKKKQLEPSKIANQKELSSGSDLSSSGMTSNAKLKRRVGKVLPNGKLRKGKVHFAASVTCGGATVYSNIKSQKILTRKGKIVSKKKFLNALGKKL